MTSPVLLAALLAVEAVTPGFTADELARQAVPGNAIEVRAALGRAEVIRAALIIDPARTPEIIDPMETRALQSALGQFDPASAAQISYFMRGAVTRIAPAGAALIAGYYNPLLDVWLVARLEQVSGEWRIARARLIDGAVMRGGGGLWHEARENVFAVLVENYRRSIASFDHGLARARASLPHEDAFAPLAARTNEWIGSLATWRRDEPALAAAERVRAAIAAGRLRATGLGDDGIARQIDGLPLAIRRTYAITGAARRGEIVSLILVSPMAPELLLVLDLDAADRPLGIAVVNLGNAQPRPEA